MMRVLALGSVLGLVACGGEIADPKPTEPVAVVPEATPPAPQSETGRWFFATSRHAEEHGSSAVDSALVALRHDGTSWRRVVLSTALRPTHAEPSFSPSGRTALYFAADGADTVLVAHAVTPEGFGPPVEIARSTDESPSYWWHGEHVLLRLGRAPDVLVSFRPDGSFVNDVLPENAAVAPDGAHAIGAGRVLDLPYGDDGPVSHALGLAADEQISYPSLTDDGRYAVVTVYNASERWLRVVDLSGSEPTAHDLPQPRSSYSNEWDVAYRVSFVPGGTQFLISDARYEGASSTVWQADATTVTASPWQGMQVEAGQVVKMVHWMTPRIVFADLSAGLQLSRLETDGSFAPLELPFDQGFGLTTPGSDDGLMLSAQRAGEGGLLDLSTSPATFRGLGVGACGAGNPASVEFGSTPGFGLVHCARYSQVRASVGSATGVVRFGSGAPVTSWDDFVDGRIESTASGFEPGSARWLGASREGLVLHADPTDTTGTVAPESRDLVVVAWQGSTQG